MVRGQQSVQTPPRAGDRLPDVTADRHCEADGSGHGVSVRSINIITEADSEHRTRLGRSATFL